MALIEGWMASALKSELLLTAGFLLWAMNFMSRSCAGQLLLQTWSSLLTAAPSNILA
jgi:hypothetical protein